MRASRGLQGTLRQNVPMVAHSHACAQNRQRGRLGGIAAQWRSAPGRAPEVPTTAPARRSSRAGPGPGPGSYAVSALTSRGKTPCRENIHVSRNRQARRLRTKERAERHAGARMDGHAGPAHVRGRLNRPAMPPGRPRPAGRPCLALITHTDAAGRPPQASVAGCDVRPSGGARRRARGHTLHHRRPDGPRQTPVADIPENSRRPRRRGRPYYGTRHVAWYVTS